MSNNYGYKRVSTEGQDTARQLVDLSVEFTRIFEDKLSGKDTNRPQLKECLHVITSGDTLWVHSIDRLARNVEDLRDIVFKLMDRGVTVKFIKEGLEFSGNINDTMKHAISKMLLTLLGAVAEFERSLINGRVQEGVKVAQTKGIKFGKASPVYGTKSGNGRELNDVVIEQRKQASAEATAYVVPEIYKALKYLGKRPTQAKIATFLNDANIPTPKNRKMWTQSSVGRIIDKHNINIFA